MPKIATFSNSPEEIAAATALATKLHIPVTTDPCGYDYLLIYTDESLGLHKVGSRLLPLHIDFLSGKMTYRRQHATVRKEILARALGLKNQTQPTIVDATGGLGRDSFILAALGFEVEIIERSPIIHALLEDGIKRALLDPNVAPIVKRMTLIQANAITWMKEHTGRAELIYLDPMFPERSKSALVKKEMQIFHDIIGNDDDADKLLEAALTCATKRVVVKRPRLSAHLAGMKPSYELSGSSSRFDIYLAS